MFRMLRDVEDELILVKKAQIERDVNVRGLILATKLMDHDEQTCIVVSMRVDKRGNSKGNFFRVESDCLVEVLDGNSTPTES